MEDNMEYGEFAAINMRNKLKGYGYSEIKVYDRRGNLLSSVNDHSIVTRIQPLNDDEVKIVVR